MNIYLTSYGLDTRNKKYMNCYDEIIELLKNKNVAIISNEECINCDETSSLAVKQELNKNNIEATIFKLSNDVFQIGDYNALYIVGDDPKNLMDSIMKDYLFQQIQVFADNGGIIIGQSAGAMIFSKKYLDTSTKSLLICKNGFDYENKLIVPHYDNLPKAVKENIPKDILEIDDNDNLIKLDNEEIVRKRKKISNVIKAHSYCSKNRNSLEKVDVCGCFYCLKIFNPHIIKSWCDNGETAMCPYCGIDSIIYENSFYPITKDFLNDMKDYWF